MTWHDVIEVREEERAKEFRDALKLASFRVSLPLYLLFWLADLVYAWDYRWAFLSLRLLMIPVNMLIHRIATRAQTLNEIEWTALHFTFVNGIIITLMIFSTEGVSSEYYAGLNLVALGALAFFPWSIRRLPLAILSIYGPYYLISISRLPTGADGGPLAIHSFFIFGTIAVSLVKYHFTENLRLREIRSRLLLAEEIRSRENFIRDKADEALHLRSLANQFSPQVVQAIRHGDLDVMRGTHRAEICAMFVDIVNSTDHVNRISAEHFDVVLSMFMEDTMKVLLKYDITIDKFLGDGVLAFSNDPVAHDDYVERAVNAAQEIRLRIQSRRKRYQQLWRTELQIRIGIARGPANVGFYGSSDYFKMYTAIGGVVNLANRLCTAAEPSQILVSEGVAQALPPSRYVLRFVGEPMLKGFESEAIRVYEMVETGAFSARATEISLCPNGHGVLHLDHDDSGIYVFKCRECSYVLDAAEVTVYTPENTSLNGSAAA